MRLSWLNSLSPGSSGAPNELSAITSPTLQASSDIEASLPKSTSGARYQRDCAMGGHGTRTSGPHSHRPAADCMRVEELVACARRMRALARGGQAYLSLLDYLG